MTKRIVVAAIIIFMTFQLFSKIKAPDEVGPVFYNNVKIVVDHGNPGYVYVYDMNTGKKLWEKRIYSIWISPFLEKDVQLVFIVSMKLKDNSMEIINSKNNKYLLNLDTKKVKKIKNK